MSIHYFAANLNLDNSGSPSIECVEEVSKEEVETMYELCDFTRQIGLAKEAYNIAVRNGRELLNFLNHKNLSIIYEKYRNKARIISEANRLVYNFCASIETFISYAKIVVKRKNEEAQKDFELFLNNIFDLNFEYRFFYKLRNYVVHYCYPYSQMEVLLPNTVKLVCERDLLLEYSGWGAIVSKDLKSLDKEIDISPYIEKELVLITVIFYRIYIYYIENYQMANSAVANFCRKYRLRDPVVLETDDDLHYGEKKFSPLPIEEIMEGIDNLKRNPNVKIVLTDMEVD